MEKQGDVLSNKGDRGLIKSSPERDGAVVGNPSSGALAEIIFKVSGGRSDAFHMIGEALQGGLTGGSMRALVIDGGEPVVELVVKFLQGVSLEGGEKLSADRLKESLHFATALGFEGFGVHQGNTKGCGDFVEELGAEGGTVVDVKFPGESPFQESAAQGAKIGVEVLVQKEGAMGNQAAHVIDEGKEIGLAPLISHHDHGAVQGIALPEIVRGVGFKFAPIDGDGGGRPEYPFVFEEPVEGAFAQEQTGGSSRRFSSSVIRVGREHRGISDLSFTITEAVSSSMTRLRPWSFRPLG